MLLNTEIDWPNVFRGFISRETLADPKNQNFRLVVSTMLFVEAGMLELDDQICGRSQIRKEGLAWARITRDVIVKRAKALLKDLRAKARTQQEEEAREDTGALPVTVMRAHRRNSLCPGLTVEVLKKVKVGHGCFRDRWDGKGGMAAHRAIA